MHQRILDSMKGVNVILYLLPFWKDLDEDYLKTIEITKNTKAKKYLLLTKVDKADNKASVYEAAAKFNETKYFDKILPISSFKNINIDQLIEEVKKDLELDIAYYGREDSHEYTDKFYAAEIIREKALFNLDEEIPHHLFVSIEEFELTDKKVFLRAELIVDRENLKRIVVGKEGSMIKIIGQKAREELENYFGRPVYIETFVKVRKDWKNKDSIIKNI